jgi:hypothetical protein
MTTSICANLAGANADCTNSAVYATARAYFYNTYATEIQNLVGMSIPNVTVFDEVCEYMFFSYYSVVALNFTPTAR